MWNSEGDSNILNTIFIGEIASVHNYGAFVRIPGSKSQGLIHRSQVSKVPVDDVTEILSRGDKVWCKVINITDDNKIGLSMKVVDQGNGKDLDPNGVQIHQDEQKRKAYVPGSRKKTIQLEAVFNTTCSKCGTHGHLARDCFKSPDGKTYELIPEDDIVCNQPEVLICTENRKTRIIHGTSSESSDVEKKEAERSHKRKRKSSFPGNPDHQKKSKK
ncbi:hypothetical protein L9F63_004924 [Diploptera punctata]|uniref:Nucleolar protein of 40 kDa n=1 Tax=Diploptera punctata TaxID=6984 RepID=A0AAD7ZEG9_DIPPU|nr:hypothetical protein L9F63_004924 [Diploptera punctata]